MRVLITGGKGQLAQALLATAPSDVHVRVVSRAECDVTELPIVVQVFTSFRPEIVINTAAYTAVDAAEENEGLAFRVNARGAEHVAKAAELVGARLIHLSTDYVFDGTRSTPYPPDAPTNPVNVYGASKLEGEKLALDVAPNAMVVRTSWLYSTTGKNFLVRVLKALRDTPSLFVVSDQRGSPTSAHELAATIWKIPIASLRGTFHWANLGSASWYDFAREIARIAHQLGLLRQEPEIIAVRTQAHPRRANRPAYSVLDSTKLAACLKVSPSAWQDALRIDIARDVQRLSTES